MDIKKELLRKRDNYLSHSFLRAGSWWRGEFPGSLLFLGNNG